MKIFKSLNILVELSFSLKEILSSELFVVGLEVLIRHVNVVFLDTLSLSSLCLESVPDFAINLVEVCFDFNSVSVFVDFNIALNHLLRCTVFRGKLLDLPITEQLVEVLPCSYLSNCLSTHERQVISNHFLIKAWHKRISRLQKVVVNIEPSVSLDLAHLVKKRCLFFAKFL
jgi:hypothetical protein